MNYLEIIALHNENPAYWQKLVAAGLIDPAVLWRAQAVAKSLELMQTMSFRAATAIVATENGCKPQTVRHWHRCMIERIHP